MKETLGESDDDHVYSPFYFVQIAAAELKRIRATSVFAQIVYVRFH